MKGLNNKPTVLIFTSTSHCGKNQEDIKLANFESVYFIKLFAGFPVLRAYCLCSAKEQPFSGPF